MRDTRRKPGIFQFEDARLLKPGVTKQIQQAVADQVDSFEEADFDDNGMGNPVRARIEVTTNDLREAFNVDPVSGGLGYLRANGDEFWLDSWDQINDWRAINDTGATQFTITVTFFYKAH